MIDFTSRQLRAFLLVAHHRSFTRAADALLITPSGLSVLIRELERQVGFRLFDRTTRHVAPTRYGTELLATVRRSVEELDLAVSRLGREAESTHTLALGAPPLIAANLVPPAVRAFRLSRPDFQVRVFDGNHLTIRHMVETGELDMGLGVFFASTPDLRRTPLFRFSLMVIRPSVAPTTRPAAMTWAALRGEPLVSLPPESPLQQLIDKQLRRAGVDERGSVVNTLDTQIALVEAGEGIAVIPSYGLPACRNRAVTMHPLVKPVVHLEFCQIRRRGRSLPPGAEEFTTFLQDEITTWAGRAGVV